MGTNRPRRSLLSHLSMLPDEIMDRLRTFARAGGDGGPAARTVAALRSDARLFADWCADQDLAWLPADPATVAAFVTAMAGSGRKPATIDRYLASISAWHQAADLATPTRAKSVKAARQIHLDAIGPARRQAKPVGEREIADIRRSMAAGPGDLSDLRDLALLLVASDTLARVSELVALRWDDLAVEDSGEGRLALRRQSRWLSAEAVAALHAWRLAHDHERERRNQPPTPHIFRGLSATRWSAALDPGSVSRILRRRLAAAGYDPAGYSAQSTRIGSARDLAEGGADLAGIMQAGGWKDAKMAARYAERPVADGGAMARLRGRRGGG